LSETVSSPEKPIPFKVGLTGGIGSGKSTVARLFADSGVPTFSADAISHQLCEPGQAGYLEIVKSFGSSILNKDGTINRPALGDQVFNDNTLRAQLEHILHPMIKQTMHQRADAIDYPYCILDIPLLINSAERDRVNRVLVVHCERAIRLQRVKQRSAWSEEKIARVMASQPDDEAFKVAADDWLDNSGKIEDMAQRISKLHAQYLLLASGFRKGLCRSD
jgi:dephospho-CoA kinase